MYAVASTGEARLTSALARLGRSHWFWAGFRQLSGRSPKLAAFGTQIGPLDRFARDAL